MKTITKTFYVNDNCMDDLRNYRSFDYRYFSTSQSMDNENEIQISWQESERKIEITESEFIEKIRKIAPSYWTNAFIEHISKQLFGASDE